MVEKLHCFSMTSLNVEKYEKMFCLSLKFSISCYLNENSVNHLLDIVELYQHVIGIQCPLQKGRDHFLKCHHVCASYTRMTRVCKSRDAFKIEAILKYHQLLSPYSIIFPSSVFLLYGTNLITNFSAHLLCS